MAPRLAITIIAGLVLSHTAWARDLGAEADEAEARLAEAEQAVASAPHSPEAYVRLSLARYGLAVAQARRDGVVTKHLDTMAQGPILWDACPELMWGALRAGTKALHVAKMPDDRALLYENLARLYETRDEPELALRAYQCAEAYSEHPADDLYQQARLYAELGDGRQAWRATWRLKWAVSPPVTVDWRVVALFVAWVLAWGGPIGVAYWKVARPRGWTPAAAFLRFAAPWWRRWAIGLVGAIAVYAVGFAWAHVCARLAAALVSREAVQQWTTLRLFAVAFAWAVAWAYAWVGRASLWVAAPIAITAARVWWAQAGVWGLTSEGCVLEGDALAACLCVASLPVGVALGALIRHLCTRAPVTPDRPALS